MYVRHRFVSVSVIVLAALAPWVTFAQEHTVKPSKNLITGLVDGEEVEELAPPHGFVATKVEFEKLWKAWLLEDKVPAVDFQSSLVVVATSREGPIKEAVLVDAKKTGDMKIRVKLEARPRARPCTSCSRSSRAGIKTIEGEAIADK